MSKIELIHGDCVDIMRGLPDASVDSIVTDPPAGIAFMGKAWDKDHGGRDAWIANMTTIAAECLRVLKPGGHALVWALPRTSHWTATAWENAGFEVRDRVAHVFGSGFPKSHNVSKAIDKAAGAEREVVRVRTDGNKCGGANTYDDDAYIWDKSFAETAPATPEAARWDGWGTALKPAMEDWWLLRKPLRGTVAANVLAWGTGAINVDGCRVGTADNLNGGVYSKGDWISNPNEITGPRRKLPGEYSQPAGRWPANVVHDGSDEVVGLFPVTKSGSAARFFYCAKASKADRDEGLEGLPVRQSVGGGGGIGDYLDDVNSASGKYGSEKAPARNHHPTVKPTDLMRWLVRLVTPPGGVVLDPFCGSGSTGKAAALEGMQFIGIDMDAEYLEIARRRTSVEQEQLSLWHAE